MQKHLRLRTKRTTDLGLFLFSALAGSAFLGLVVSALIQGPGNFFADALGPVFGSITTIIGYLILIPSLWVAWVMLSSASILMYRTFSPKPYLTLREDGFSVLWRAGTKNFKWTDAATVEFSSTSDREGELLIKAHIPKPRNRFSNLVRTILQEHGVWVVLPERNSVTSFAEIKAYLEPLGLLE